MQREMDFTDLIDWGRGADLASVAASQPQCCMRLLGLLQFGAPKVFIISNGMRGDIVRVSFPEAASEILSTAGNSSLLCISQNTTGFGS